MQAGPGLVGRGDADPGEPGRQQQVVVLGLGKGAVEAADLPFGVGKPAGVDALVGDDVADAQPAAVPQHPECPGEDARLVGGQVDDAVGDDHVHVPVRQRDVLDVASQERGVGDPRRGGVGAGEGEHVRAGVQAVGAAAGGDPAGGQQHVQAAAGSQVQDGLAGMQGGDRQGVAAAEADAQRVFGGTVGSGIGGGAEALIGERARVAVGDRGPGQGGAGQAGVTDDDSIPVGGGRVAGHWDTPQDWAGTGTGRPMTMSAAVGKQSTQASLIR